MFNSSHFQFRWIGVRRTTTMRTLCSHIAAMLLLFSSPALSQDLRGSVSRFKHYDVSLQKENSFESDSVGELRRLRIFTSLGTPFLFNLGTRYMFSDKFFGEIEVPIIARLVPQSGFFALSAGIRHPEGTYSNCKICISGEVSLTLGNTQVFFGPSGFYMGGNVAGNIETQLGVLLFLRIGGAYFPSGYGTGLLELGIGWNF